jgi:hypothetical protein
MMNEGRCRDLVTSLIDLLHPIITGTEHTGRCDAEGERVTVILLSSSMR